MTPSHETLVEFIKANGDKRVTKAAFKFYKNPDNVVVGSFEYEGDNLIGVSMSGLDNSEVVHSLIVVHKDYRNRGIGTKLLQQTIELLKSKNLTYSGFVAEDNSASLRIFAKCGAVEVSRLSRKRKSGSFKAVKFEK